MSGLFDIIKMIGDYIAGILEGMLTLIESFAFIVGIGNSVTAFTWLPSAVVSVMSLSLILIVILRVVGR